MSSNKKFFLGLCIVLGILFAFDCFSIIQVFIFNFVNTSENLLAVVYLFIQMLILALLFYWSLKAYFLKSRILGVMSKLDDGTPSKSCRIKAIIVGSIFLVVAVYFGLIWAGVKLPPDFFATGVKAAIVNFSLMIFTIALSFIIYPLVVKGKEEFPDVK